jgi:hypothetical protein
MTAALRVVAPALDECVVDHSDERPRVPDGLYSAVFTHHETALAFRNPKVFLHFRIVDPGEHFGKVLFRAYRVASLIGKPGRFGRFKVRRRHELFLMLVRVLEIKARPDRLSPQALKNVVVRIKTRTVTTDFEQRELPQWLHYSVVADVLEAMTNA